MPIQGTRNAIALRPTIQMSASHAPTPKRRVGACSTTTGSTAAPATSAPPDPIDASGLSESSCTSHPWFEDGVQDVDEHVDRDVADGNHRDKALDLLVLALCDRAEQLGTHSWNL